MIPFASQSLFALTLCCAIAGCSLELTGVPIEDRAEGDGDGDTDADGGLGSPDLCTTVRYERGEEVRVEDKVDLLFVIDDSGSMAEEQAKLAALLPMLVETLLSGRLPGSEKSLDFVPVGSLHLGVVSTNMGTDGAFALGSCDGKGDDGLLRHEVVDAVKLDDPACQGELFDGSSYLSYDPFNDPSKFEAIEEFLCVAALGTSGCGLEQPLESMWKALAPSDDLSFITGAGHGEDANEGFLRKDAVLAIVHVSDEDDCSITKAGRSLFDPSSEDPRFAYDGEPENLKGKIEGLNFRCAYEATQESSGELFSGIDRFVDGLLSLKPDDQDKVIFLGIAGIPEEAESMAGSLGGADFAAILELPAMQVVPGLRVCTPAEEADDPGDTCGKPVLDVPPEPACTSPDGNAAPARRFVELARRLDGKTFNGNVFLRSVCSSDYSEALSTLAERIGTSLKVPCINSTIARHIANCELVEILPEGETACDGSKGRYFRKTRTFETDDGPQTRTTCTINRVFTNTDDEVSPNPNAPEGVDGAAGWYYDMSTIEAKNLCESGTRLVLTSGAELGEDALSFFSCEIQPEPGYGAIIEGSVGTPCARDQPDETIAFRECPGESEGAAACEGKTNTCQMTCGNERECPADWTCEHGYTNVEGEDISLCVPAICPFVPLDER